MYDHVTPYNHNFRPLTRYSPPGTSGRQLESLSRGDKVLNPPQDPRAIRILPKITSATSIRRQKTTMWSSHSSNTSFAKMTGHLFQRGAFDRTRRPSGEKANPNVQSRACWKAVDRILRSSFQIRSALRYRTLLRFLLYPACFPI